MCREMVKVMYNAKDITSGLGEIRTLVLLTSKIQFYTAFFDTVFNLEYHTNTFVLCLYVRLGQLIKEDSTREFFTYTHKLLWQML
jgi:hypothetical protein